MPDKAKDSAILLLNSNLFASHKELEKIRDNLSAVVFHEDHLWLGGDEGTSIDLMARDAAGNFGGPSHRRFDLRPLLKLPGDADAEIDIEGLDVDGGYLWVVGSHSVKRKKPEKNKTPAENIARLAELPGDGNRFTLGRVPFTTGPVLEPVAQHGGLTAARLEGNDQGNLLTRALKDDPHIGLFVPRPENGHVVGIPSKDNGLDIEGLAVSGNRVFLGLRGPVLRGWAVILELQLAESSNGLLKLEPLGAPGTLYRKHFLRLKGLGVRDLAIHEKDLYILAGPTMDLDGPVFIYRWSKALEQASDSLTPDKELTQVVSVPFGEEKDHAEGITLLPTDPLSVLVCYDSPDRALEGAGANGVKADIFALSS